MFIKSFIKSPRCTNSVRPHYHISLISFSLVLPLGSVKVRRGTSCKYVWSQAGVFCWLFSLVSEKLIMGDIMNMLLVTHTSWREIVGYIISPLTHIVYEYLLLFVYISVCVFVCLSISLSPSLSMCPSYISIYLSLTRFLPPTYIFVIELLQLIWEM